MKIARVMISHYFLGGTKDMFKLHEDLEVEPIGIFRENGTDLFFAINDEGHLIYYTPSCITKFLS